MICIACAILMLECYDNMEKATLAVISCSIKWPSIS
jgi:hypothetical protein